MQGLTPCLTLSNPKRATRSPKGAKITVRYILLVVAKVPLGLLVVLVELAILAAAVELEALLDLPELVVRKPYPLELVELVLAVQAGIVQAKLRNELVLLVVLPYLDHRKVLAVR